MEYSSLLFMGQGWNDLFSAPERRSVMYSGHPSFPRFRHEGEALVIHPETAEAVILSAQLIS